MDFNYTIYVSGDKHPEQISWCEQKFGPRWNATTPMHRDGIWCCFWAGPEYKKLYRWEFKNKQDAIFFSLRWS